MAWVSIKSVGACRFLWRFTAAIISFSRVVVNFSAAGAEAVSVGVGAAVVVTAVSAGWVLSSAGRALCFLPSERGAALLHHERIW